VTGTPQLIFLEEALTENKSAGTAMIVEADRLERQ
jgi:hypothetical protein